MSGKTLVIGIIGLVAVVGYFNSDKSPAPPVPVASPGPLQALVDPPKPATPPRLVQTPVPIASPAPPPAKQAPPTKQTQPEKKKAEALLTAAAIAAIIVQASRQAYYSSRRPCACPDDTMRNGRRCGGNSAYSKPGGAQPLCYPTDVTTAMITAYKARATSSASNRGRVQ